MKHSLIAALTALLTLLPASAEPQNELDLLRQECQDLRRLLASQPQQQAQPAPSVTRQTSQPAVPFVRSGPLAVTTWNLEWFPSGIAFKTAAPEVEQTRVEAAATALKPFAPDILFIQEVRDAAACDKLAKAMGAGLKTAVCSSFVDAAGLPMFQQCAILTTLPVLEVRAERWHTFGFVDPPRGMAYALLDTGDGLVACFSLHLKSNLKRAPRDHQLNILKRELAIDQLLRFIRDMPKRADGRTVEKFIIAGDFNTTFDQPDYLSENTLRALLENGFANTVEGVPPAERVTLPGSAPNPNVTPYPDVTFDYIFWKGFARQLSWRLGDKAEVSDHKPLSVAVE